MMSNRKQKIRWRQAEVERAGVGGGGMEALQPLRKAVTTTY